MKHDRRAPTTEHIDSIPVRLVIILVGAALILSLGISAALIYQGKSAGEMLAITLSCITGLLALLGRTTTAQPLGDRSNPATVVTNPTAPLDVTTADPPPAPAPKDDTDAP